MIMFNRLISNKIILKFIGSNLNKLVAFLIIFGVTTTQKFMEIHINHYSNVYIRFSYLTQMQYKLLFNKVIYIYNYFCLISTHKSIQIHINTHNYVYNRFI
jgi:hypothetical protein